MLFNAGQLVVTTLENTFTFGDFGASGYVRVRFWYVMVLYGSGLTTLFGSGSIRVSVLHIRRTIGRVHSVRYLYFTREDLFSPLYEEVGKKCPSLCTQGNHVICYKVRNCAQSTHVIFICLCGLLSEP